MSRKAMIASGKAAAGCAVVALGGMPFAVDAVECNNGSASMAKSGKYNVIFILTDDQGYGDMACHGNPNILTPAIDRLHAESVCFENFHSGTTSAPSRAGLMTGHYCNATGVWHTIMGRSILSLDEVTLSEAFLNSNYNTAMFGKWHLGDNYPYRPQDRGFQMAFYHGGGGVGQTPDYWGNNYFDDTYFRNGVPEKTTGFSTDVLFDDAMRFIDKKKSDEKPFFCYLSTPAPHHPFNVEDKYYNLYKDNPDVVNAGFYGMITNLDENLARLDDYLKKNNLDKNTILIFMTDNGTDRGVELDKDQFRVRGYNAGMRGLKGSVYDGGHRVAYMMRIPNMEPQVIRTLSSYVDFMPTMVDLCALQMPREVQFHGTTLVPLLKGDTIPVRYLFNDTQRGEDLARNKPNCVMSQQWRLVNNKELYNIEKDAEQRHDLAAQHPELVKEMQKAFSDWWENTTGRANRMEYIPVGDPNANPVVLNGHDTHDNIQRGTPWNQEYVRIAVRTYGFWAMEVVEDGDYLFEVYRYAPEAHTSVLAALPQGKDVPNGDPLPEGVALPITGAVIRLNGREIGRRAIDKTFDQEAIPISATLRKGQYNLEANFEDAGGEFCGYYVKVTKK